MKGFSTQEESQTLQKQKENMEQMSILEKFPEYNFIFVISNKYWKEQRFFPRDFFHGWRGGVGFLSFLLGFFCICGSMASFMEGIPIIVGIMLIIVGVFFFVLCIKMFKKHHKIVQSFPPLSSIADYITQPASFNDICFFVKDSKFGLMQIRRGKILIPAMYYKLEWYKKFEYLYAYNNEGSKPLLIDINNNRLK